MQKVVLLTSIGLLFFCMSTFAQKVNTDSLSLVSKISSDQLKLGKLQNQLEQKTKNKQDASAQAQKSANENSDAADKLSDKPENKKLARKANTKAGNAKSDSRNARRESDRLDKLNNDIQDLKNRIADNQAKLNKYIQKREN
ncbi:hypothetical protein A3860_30415 [Niastella vici]|uniref:SlyB protein n=1 Tax=Niastella vici TaxID=1703345 RepID=A0A1V9FUK0_9BACT|nr:hypothetical protein [Niastella vici]OQP62000.1 hypothetical protein A3860_30415 [Niastella vici]